MPAYEDAYNATLLAARQAILQDGVPARVIERLLVEYARMLVRVDAEGAAGVITEARARSLSASIRKIMEEYGAALYRLLTEGTTAAANRGAQAHVAAVQAAARAARVEFSVGGAFARVPQRALELMMVRRGLPGGIADTYKTLINRKITNAAADVDRLLFSAVGRGQSAGRTTFELAQLMARGEDIAALKKLRGGASLYRRLHAGSFDALLGGIDNPGSLRTLLSDSRRIAVSETNGALHESLAEGMAASPLVDIVQWAVSGRHHAIPGLAPDVCDALAEADVYGYGAGRYNSKSVPALPHPHCGCRLSAVCLRPADWGRAPRPLTQPGRLTDSDAKRLLPGKTPRFMETQIETANKRIQDAYRVAVATERVAA